MVKNTFGGTGAKSLARKNENRTSGSKLRLSEDELEIYGCITKLFGNGMCEVYSNDNKRYMGHIRNKHRGKNKRHNTVYQFSMVLVGLREWENPHKSCDIIAIYEDCHIEQLKNIPSINIRNLITMCNTKTFDTNSKNTETKEQDNDDGGIIFSEHDCDQHSKFDEKYETEFKMEKMDEIDISEI
jgi:initiation factor 1A